MDRQQTGAFMDYPAVPVSSAQDGSLKGLTLAVKDLFDVTGYPTGCGNPTKLAEASPAESHAPVVNALLDAGAEFVGKTITDELAFSLHGVNAHYGTPVNGAAPDRIPGGSSCGSASAVSNAMADIAFGTDTGGSVRCPASYCGLVGLRPTHGRVSLDACMPLAASFDTCGWFTRDIDIYARVGDILLGEDTAGLPTAALNLSDARALIVDDAHRAVFDAAVPQVAAHVASVESGPVIDDLDDWLWVFRSAQGAEIWQTHGEWVERAKPDFGPGVKERFEWASGISADDAAKAATRRAEFTEQVSALVADKMFILPTVPAIAPLKATPMSDLEVYRNRALTMLMISGLAGLPQLTLPMATHGGAPFGISIMGPRGSDRALIALGQQIMSAV